MNHIFVSYSRKNEKTVDSFTDRMRNAGIQVWQDKSGAGTGIPFSTKWFSMIVEAIYLADGAVVFRSPQWEQSRICGKEYDLIRRCALPCLELDPAEVDADPEAALGEVRRFIAFKVRNMPNSRRGTLYSCAYELKSRVNPYQLIENPRGLSDTLEYLFVDLGGMKKQMEEQNYAEKDPEIYPFMQRWLKFARGAMIRRIAGVSLGAIAVLAAVIMGAGALMAVGQGSAENEKTYTGQAVAGQMGLLRESDPSAAASLALGMGDDSLTFTSYYSLSMNAVQLLDENLPVKVISGEEAPDAAGAAGTSSGADAASTESPENGAEDRPEAELSPGERFETDLSADAGSAVITDSRDGIKRTVNLPLVPESYAARDDGGSLAFSAGSRILVCDPSSGSLIRLSENYEQVRELRYDEEEGRSRILAVTERGTVLLWDDPVPVKNAERRNIRYGVFLDTEEPQAIYLDGEALVIQGAAGGREFFPMDGRTMQDTGFAVSPDGKTAAVILGGEKFGIALVSLESGALMREISTEYMPTALAFSADGQSVCASAYGCGMMRAAVRDGGVEYGPEGMYFGNIARYGDQWLLTDYSGICVLFDGELNLVRDCGPVNYVQMPCFALAANAERGQLFTVNRGGGNTDGCARFLPEKGQINAFVVPRGEKTDANTAVALSADGEYVVFGYPDGKVRIYETEHMYLSWEKQCSGESVSALHFSGDGQKLYVLGASGSVYTAAPEYLALNTGIEAMRSNWGVLKERMRAFRDGTDSSSASSRP